MTKKLNAFNVLLILTIIMLLLMAVTIFKAVGDDEDFAPLFPEMLSELNSINTVRFNSRQGDFTLYRQRGEWFIREHFDYMADGRQIRRMLVDIAESRILERKTDNPEHYLLLGVEGIEDGGESVQITMLDQDETVAQLVLGRTRDTARWDGPTQHYARRGGEDRSWLVEGYLNLSPVMMNWVQSQIVDIERERIAKVTITQPDGSSATLINLGQRNRFGTPEDREETVFVYSQLGYDIAGSLHQLRMQDVQPAEQFSRGDSEVVTAKFTTFDGMVVTSETSFNDGFYFTTLTAQYDPASITAAPDDIVEMEVLKTSEQVQQEVNWINENLSGWVYRVSGFTGTNLMRARSDIVTEASRAIPMPVDPMMMQ